MQLPPLTLTNISLLFAIGAIATLITVEITSARYGQVNFAADRKKLKTAGCASTIIFLIPIVLRVVGIILNFNIG